MRALLPIGSVSILLIAVTSIAPSNCSGDKATLPPLPADRGVQVRRLLPDYSFVPESGEYEANVENASGQPMISWDGLIRFSPKTVIEGGLVYYGLVAQTIDYRNFTSHESGTVGWSFSSDEAGDHPQGFPLWKALWYHSPTGFYVHDKPLFTPDFKIALDDPRDNPAGVGTGLTRLFHSVIVPNPERTSENPYLSDAVGGAPDGTLHMTYDFLLLATVVHAPDTHDADFDPSHDFHATDERQRLVTGLGRLTVKFESGPGGQRIPTAIVGGGVDHSTFAVLQTPGSLPSARTVLRGFEPGITRDGNVLVFHTQMNRYTNDPSGPRPGSNHVVFSRRLQGSFADPENPAHPLRFSEPEHLSSLVSYRDLPVPMTYGPGSDSRPPLTYGERYPIFRHKILSPLGDHVYEPGEPVGGAYPWISLDGGYLAMSTSKGVGDYLDLNAVTSAIHRSGGIDFCLAGNSCSPPSDYYGSPHRRAGFAIIGEGLVARDGEASYHQMKIIDSPLNETRRALARVTQSAFRLDGPWSPTRRLPVSHFDHVRVRPESKLTMMYLKAGNQLGGISFFGRAHGTTAGTVSHAEEMGHYLLYSGLIASGPWLEDLQFDPDNSGAPHPNQPPVPPPGENYARYGTTLLTDFTKAPDVSGNNLQIDLNFGGAGAGGAFYPFNDPFGAYDGPLGDHERELQIGRVGQGVYLSSDGEILVREGLHSRPGALSDYDDELAVHFWYRPLADNTGRVLARGPAYEIAVGGKTPNLTVQVNADTAVGGTVTARAKTNQGFRVGSWYHVVVQLSAEASTDRARIDIWVNGSLVTVFQSPSIASQLVGLHHSAERTSFGPGGLGAASDRVMVLDEIAISNRRLRPEEIREAALREVSRVDSGPAGQDTLGVLSAWIQAAGHDPDEAFVPADNPATQEKVDLGHLLFFDSRLSQDGSISCASCHQPAAGFGDPDPVGTSQGVGGVRGRRHSPHIVNLVFQKPGDRFFRDGRADSLEAQVLMPIEDPVEMASSVDAAVQVVRSNPADYDSSVQGAFGHGAVEFTRNDLSQALATYVRSLIVGDAPLDRHQRGDAAALTPAERNGLGIFMSNCVACHSGANLSDNRFHNIGLFDLGATAADTGRFEVTDRDPDRGAFKTPGLRDLDRRATLLGHAGIHDIGAVIDSYSLGGLFRDVQGPNRSVAHNVRALHLTAGQKADLAAFLANGLKSNVDSVYDHVSPWQ